MNKLHHIKAKDVSGEGTIENGWHNFLKKNFKLTKTAKKKFILLIYICLPMHTTYSTNGDQSGSFCSQSGIS
jgi:hypothetical protein